MTGRTDRRGKPTKLGFWGRIRAETRDSDTRAGDAKGREIALEVWDDPNVLPDEREAEMFARCVRRLRFKSEDKLIGALIGSMARYKSLVSGRRTDEVVRAEEVQSDAEWVVGE